MKKYSGSLLGNGRTSMRGNNICPYVKQIEKIWGDVKTVFDYGAGFGRNVKYLRDLGYKVYAYDKFNGTYCDGWDGVSNEFPKLLNFDVVLTEYVLNVVPEYEEKKILNLLNNFSPNQYHIVRNLDLVDYLKENLSENKMLLEFFLMEYGGDILNEEEYMNLALYGYPTSKGFQRLTECDMKVIDEGRNFKIYLK